MVFAAALFSYALLAVSAFALPSSVERRERRITARRAPGSHNSKPINLVTVEGALARNRVGNSNSTHDSASSNWAGAILSSDAGTYTSVTGTFTVPTPSLSSAAGSSQAASAWVGIDGASCGSSILQTGVDFTVDDTGAVSYDGWYEWIPAASVDFTGISFSAGDVVTLTVTASSTTSGSAVIENTSSGQTASIELSSAAALCEQDAEWIVEDFDVDGGEVPFADFGTVVFTGASATTPGGVVGPGGAALSEIGQNDEILTSVSVDDTSVTISYVGS